MRLRLRDSRLCGARIQYWRESGHGGLGKARSMGVSPMGRVGNKLEACWRDLCCSTAMPTGKPMHPAMVLVNVTLWANMPGRVQLGRSD